MYLISLNYVVDLAEVDAHIEAHVEFLKKYYSLGKFVVSGRKVPRTGGVILASCSDREELKRILEEDPFFRAKVAEYDVIEFVPTMTAPGFEKLQGG